MEPARTKLCTRLMLGSGVRVPEFKFWRSSFESRECRQAFERPHLSVPLRSLGAASVSLRQGLERLPPAPQVRCLRPAAEPGNGIGELRALAPRGFLPLSGSCKTPPRPLPKGEARSLELGRPSVEGCGSRDVTTPAGYADGAWRCLGLLRLFLGNLGSRWDGTCPLGGGTHLMEVAP